jgi:hypothetical protein
MGAGGREVVREWMGKEREGKERKYAYREIRFKNVDEESEWKISYVVCLKGSVNGTRKQTKQKIQKN